jgi:hypothetical protein
MHPELIRALVDDRRAEMINPYPRYRSRHRRRHRYREPTCPGTLSLAGARVRNRVGRALVDAGSRILPEDADAA